MLGFFHFLTQKKIKKGERGQNIHDEKANEEKANRILLNINTILQKNHNFIYLYSIVYLLKHSLRFNQLVRESISQ